MDEYVFSISEYIELINITLKQKIISIKGEITSYSIRGSAVFFTIADQKEEAILECVIWKSNYERLGIDLEEGMEVKLTGTASIYKKNGRFSFVANTIIPLGEGALKKAFEKLQKQLLEAGYFDQDRKREIPEFIQSIGLITALGSDAKKDFETHIGNHGYKIYFHDVRVEGTNSIKEIVKAFNKFNESTAKLDVLVLTRGGGSLESLMAFNSEDVAKAIYKSKIPVLCAVGHENDISIADLVADLRASTPTDAGKIISQPYKEVSNTLVQNTKYIEQAFSTALKDEKREIDNSMNNLISQYELKLTQIKRKVETFQNIQMLALSSVLNTYNQLEIKFINRFQTLTNKLNNIKATVNYSEKLLHANDPNHKLKQGYSITLTESGKVLKTAEDAANGDILITKLFKGKLKSKVQI